MKNKWIWIVGIILGLLIISGAIAMPFLHNAMVGSSAGFGYGQNFARPMMNGSFGHPGMMFDGHQNFGMGIYTPFAFGFMFIMFFVRLIPWLIIGLILWGVYQLGKSAGAKSAENAKAAEVVSTPAKTTEEEI